MAASKPMEASMVKEGHKLMTGAIPGLVGLLLVFILTATSLACQQPPPPPGPQPVQAAEIEVVHVGGGSLASQVVRRLETVGSQVERLPDLPVSIELNSHVVVVFDGGWFANRADDTQVHGFLKRASSSGAALVVIGENTSRLMEALDKADVHKLVVTETGIVRNPAYFNPPQVGFKVVETGDGWIYPSTLFSKSTNPDTLAEALVNWLSQPVQGDRRPEVSLPPHLVRVEPVNGTPVRLDFRACATFDITEEGMGQEWSGPVWFEIAGTELGEGTTIVNSRIDPTEGTACTSRLGSLLEEDALANMPPVTEGPINIAVRYQTPPGEEYRHAWRIQLRLTAPEAPPEIHQVRNAYNLFQKVVEQVPAVLPGTFWT
jgi:hypothetical protein